VYRLQSKIARWALDVALIVSIVAAAHASALAQNVATPATQPTGETSTSGCPEHGVQSATQTATIVSVSPQRGWQMEGREIQAALTSANPLSSKPLVCFRWRLQGGKGKFIKAEPVRIIPHNSAAQQRPSLTFAVPVPPLGLKPPRDVQSDDAGVYTPDNAAPIAEIHIFPLGTDGKPVEDLTTTIAVVAANDYCNTPTTGTRTDSGTVVPSESKNWQPAGGEIAFAIRTYSKTVPTDALIKTCFRWKLIKGKGDPGPFKDSGAGSIRVLERQPDTIKLAVSVPTLEKQPDRLNQERMGSYAIPYLAVPETDVRVLLFDAELNPIFDAWTKTGVSSTWLAAMIALLTVAVAFVALHLVCRRRVPKFGKTSTLLCLITTRRGFASLSQFQIMLWTFVVMASAVYVIALSADLIPITAGTLGLLGISGAAALIAKAKSESDAAAAPQPPGPAAAEEEAVRAEYAAKQAENALPQASAETRPDAELAAKELRAKADAARAKANAAEAIAAAAKARSGIATAVDKAKAEEEAREAEKQAQEKTKTAAIADATADAVTRIRHPRWSDLIMEEIEGRELDVTRVQMLLFTLVTAGFVVVKVITSYEIPAIPESFLILMGISNGVYVTSKFVTNPQAKS
jgi:hypothetical protein